MAVHPWSLRLLALVLALVALPSRAAGPLRIVILQAKAGDARKYQPLLAYLAARGVSAEFVAAPDPRTATEMFASGRADAMFGGSGISAVMLMKGLAQPVARPMGLDGVSSYHAVVVAPKGSPRFDKTGSYFDGKRVIFQSLASAGELYFKSTGPSRPAEVLRAASHGAALDALARGRADVAVVKNHVWSAEKAKYAALEVVGEDEGENPDGTLVVARRIDPEIVQRISGALLALEADRGPAAAQAREGLKIRGYVPTSEKDFAHTIAMLRKAGVQSDPAFGF